MAQYATMSSIILPLTPVIEQRIMYYYYDINNTVMATVGRLIPGTEYTIVVIPTVIYYYSTGIPSDTLTVTTGLSQGSVV